jgi:hypothetical protein
VATCFGFLKHLSDVTPLMIFKKITEIEEEIGSLRDKISSKGSLQNE